MQIFAMVDGHLQNVQRKTTFSNFEEWLFYGEAVI